MVRVLARTPVWLSSSVFLLTAGTATNADVIAPIVDVGYAQYQGYFDSQVNITNFLGIRYAAPPTGKWRFQAPQSPADQSGVQPATQNPNMCYQASYGFSLTAPVSPHGNNKRQTTTPTVSEDCLFLNVFLPGTPPSEPVTSGGLPVLVWIHGGGYQGGTAAYSNGADLVAESFNSMVVVVIQYRLGVFGFLSSNEVKEQGALNAGLLDQRLALQWVQDHIGLFGGDKTHVTIWGVSAGGGSVLQHIVANGGNTQPPLFHAGMTGSAFLPSQYDYNGRIPQLLYSETVSLTGCASSSDTFTCLQSVDAGLLEAANYNITHSAFFGTYVFVPVVDGTFIVERPTVTLASGQVNGQVLLSVTNQNEGNIFVDNNEALTTADYVSQLFPDMSYSSAQQVSLVYQGDGTALEQATQMMGDAIFSCPTYYMLQAFAGRSWKGLFAIPPAYHGMDAAYYFYNASSPPSYNNAQFITAFSQSFLSLARYYDVNTKFDPSNITPNWMMYEYGQTEMLFNRTEAGAPVVTPIQTDPQLWERCAYWSTVTGMTAQ